jgi:hypothetical protein
MGRSSGVQVLLEISIEVLVGAQRQETESSAFLDQVTDQVELLVMGELVNARPRERPLLWLTAQGFGQDLLHFPVQRSLEIDGPFLLDP